MSQYFSAARAAAAAVPAASGKAANRCAFGYPTYDWAHIVLEHERLEKLALSPSSSTSSVTSAAEDPIHLPLALPAIIHRAAAAHIEDADAKSYIYDVYDAPVTVNPKAALRYAVCPPVTAHDPFGHKAVLEALRSDLVNAGLEVHQSLEGNEIASSSRATSQPSSPVGEAVQSFLEELRCYQI